MQNFGGQSSVATMILQPVTLRSCLVEKEFDERCIIEGDVHRSRKWLSFSDINVRTEWSLDKACFNYSRGETQDIGYCMQCGLRYGAVDQQRLLNGRELMFSGKCNS